MRAASRMQRWRRRRAITLRQSQKERYRELATKVATLRGQCQRLQALNRAALSVAGDLDLERVLEAVVAEAIGVLQAEAVALFLASETHEEYVIRAQHGLTASHVLGMRAAAAEVQSLIHPGAISLQLPGGEHRTPAWAAGLLAASHTDHILLLPLQRTGRLWGLLALLGGDREAWFQPEWQEMAGEFARQAASALANAEHHRETELGAAESTFLLQISQLLSATFDARAIVQMLAEEASDLMESELCALYLYDRVADEIELTAVQGISREAMADAGLQKLSLARFPVIWRAAAEARPLASEWPGEGDLLSLLGPAFQMRASLTVPLRAHDSLLGFLFLSRHAPQRFTLAEIQLGLKLGTLAALALDNARLYADLAEQMQQLQTAQTQLLEAEKMASLGRIVAGVAHELNNPLAIISGYAQMLLDGGNVPPEMRNDLERIDRGARRAAQVVRDLLAFARQQPIVPAPVNVADLVEGALERERPALQESGIEVQVEVDKSLPPIQGDRFQLEHALRQLIANAQRAMAGHPGPGKLTIRAVYQEGVRLIVSDNGPGIPPDLLDKVFEPFVTVPQDSHNSGLGLSVCYGVVRAHGGRIWAANNPGGGATFYIEFPAMSEEV